MYCCQAAKCPNINNIESLQMMPPNFLKFVDKTSLEPKKSNQRCFNDDEDTNDCKNFFEKCVESENIKGIL